MCGRGIGDYGDEDEEGEEAEDEAGRRGRRQDDGERGPTKTQRTTQEGTEGEGGRQERGEEDHARHRGQSGKEQKEKAGCRSEAKRTTLVQSETAAAARDVCCRHRRATIAAIAANAKKSRGRVIVANNYPDNYPWG